MKQFSILFLIIFLTACAASPIVPTVTPTPTVIIPTSTSTRTPIPTRTATPTPDPTETPIPLTDAERESIQQAYMMMLFFELDANMLQELAEKVQDEELTGTDAWSSLFTLALLVNVVDESFPNVTVPDLFVPFWDKAILIHEATKDLVARWFNDEIESSTVLEEIPPHLKDIEKIMDDLDKALAKEYGFERDELDQYREEAIVNMNEIFATATPEP